jgi:hypothetical protein
MRTFTLSLALLLLLPLLLLASPVAAQQREIREANLPRTLEAQLLRMYDGAAVRYDGPMTIEAGQEVAHDIAATGGPLRVLGRVLGDVAMVGGDVVLEPGSWVGGSITVIGGEVRMAEDARVGGAITSYGAAPGPRRAEREPRDRREREPLRTDRGFARLAVRADAGYNRVEGLPLAFGPVVETAGPNPFRLEALAVWRTEAEASERMGYRLRAEQFLARRTVSLGGQVHSVVEPVERWQVRDLEASLGAVLFAHDPRDHFEREGWEAFLRLRPVRGVEGAVTYRAEKHAALAAGDPWTLFNRGRDWRPQPMVAEGRLQTLGAEAVLDWRDRADEPRSGWWLRAAAETPVSGGLTWPGLREVVPVVEPDGEALPLPVLLPARAMPDDFVAGLLDVRRYNPVGERSQLNLRLVAGGALTDTPLPPQFQHALGGLGTLPGFDTFHGDCGARRAAGAGLEGDQAGRFFPAYGCDRFALAQVEYRGSLFLDLGFGDRHAYRSHDWWDDFSIDFSPTWVVFFNAGRGWAHEAPLWLDDGARQTETLVDAGLGFLIGDLGIYAAVPLTGDVEQRPRLSLRWGARF